MNGCHRYTLFLTGDEAIFSLRAGKADGEGFPASRQMPATVVPTASTFLQMKLVKANQSVKVTGADELPGKSNYFIGNDAKKWHTNVPTYAKGASCSAYNLENKGDPMEPHKSTAEDDRPSAGHNAVTGMWTTKHLEEAVELLRSELVAVPDMIESQEDLLSRGRINGIGPRVMKRAAAKLGVGFEQHVYPATGFVRTYWKLPRSSHRRKAT